MRVVEVPACIFDGEAIFGDGSLVLMDTLSRAELELILGVFGGAIKRSYVTPT